MPFMDGHSIAGTHIDRYQILSMIQRFHPKETDWASHRDRALELYRSIGLVLLGFIPLAIVFVVFGSEGVKGNFYQVALGILLLVVIIGGRKLLSPAFRPPESQKDPDHFGWGIRPRQKSRIAAPCRRQDGGIQSKPSRALSNEQRRS